MRVLYLTVGERCSDGIIRTQVGDLLRALAAEHSITWMACVPAHRAMECREIPTEASTPQLRRVVVPLPVRNLWMSPLQARAMARLYRALAESTLREGVDLVHGRGYPAAELARSCARSFKVPWVFDPRGLYPEEMLLTAPQRVWKHQEGWRHREGEYWAQSSAAIVVSDSMADHFTHEHGARAMSVIPSHGGSGSDRMTGGTGRPARAVYVGSLGSWTSGRDIAELYLGLANSTDIPLQLTVVTRTSRAEVLPALIDAGVDAAEIELIGAAPEDVAGVLAQCAIGLLPREDRLINRVAWPVKLSEYLMAGLPVAAWESDCSWQSYAESIGALVRVERDSGVPTRRWRPLDTAARASIGFRAADLVSLEANVDAVNHVWRQAVECYES